MQRIIWIKQYRIQERIQERILEGAWLRAIYRTKTESQKHLSNTSQKLNINMCLVAW